MPEKSPHRQAVQMLVLATAFWAVSFPVMKALGLEQEKLLPGAGAWFFTALGVMYRFGAAGLVMLLFTARDLGKFSRREWEQGFFLALFGVGGILFQMHGLAYTSAPISAFLTQTYCILIPLWIALRTRRRPSLKTLLCIGLVCLGVALLAGVRFSAFKLGRGEIETLFASVLFAAQILLLENPRYAANRPLPISTVMFFGMALLCVPLVWATAPDAAACLRAYGSPAAVALIATLVIPCTLGGYLLMLRWQRGVTVTEAGLIYCLEPLFASALSLFLPGWLSQWADIPYANDHLTHRLLLGGALVTAANVLLQTKWFEPTYKINKILYKNNIKHNVSIKLYL